MGSVLELDIVGHLFSSVWFQLVQRAWENDLNFNFLPVSYIEAAV